MHNHINVAVGGPVNADYPKVYQTKFLKPGIPFALQVTDPDTKYIIKHNFDLGGETIEMPENCILEFDGGSLKNGTLTGCIDIDSTQKNVFENIQLGNTIQNEVLDLSWFKITGDCTSVLQNLFTHAKAEIRFEAGKEYTISHQLLIDHPVTVNGNGATVKMLFNHVLYPSDSAIKIEETNNCIIQNLKVIGNLEYIERPTSNVDMQYEYWQKRSEGEYELYGIQVYHCSHVKISNCTVHNCGIGILCRATHDYEVCDNHVYHTLCDAIANFVGCYNGVVSRNNTEDTGDDGISVVTYDNYDGDFGKACNNILIINNSVFNSFARGIAAIGCNDIHIRNNNITNSKIDGIKVGIEGGHGNISINITVSGNYVDCEECHGIFITNVDNPVISSNHVKVTTDYYPVYFQRTRNAVLNANNMHGGTLWLEDINVTHIYENTLVSTKIFCGHAPGSSYQNKTLYFKNNVFNNDFEENSKYVKITILTDIEFYNNIMPEVAGVISFWMSSGIKIDKETFSRVVYDEASQIEIINNSISFQGGNYNSLAGGTLVYNENYRYIRIFDKTANTLRYIPYISSGPTAADALGYAFVPGMSYFDTTENCPLWWTGTKWVEADGSRGLVNRYGVFANRPSGIPRGFAYLCTDRQTEEGGTDGIMIYYKGQDTTDPNNPVDVWIDALGRIIS